MNRHEYEAFLAETGNPAVLCRGHDHSEAIRQECLEVVADSVAFNRERNAGRVPSRRVYREYPTAVEWCLHLLDLLDAERAGDAQ